MDINLIIAVAIAAGGIYLFIKLVISPLFKAILGVIIFAAIIYILQNYLHVDFDKVLSPIEEYLSKWNWYNQIIYYIKKADIFLRAILENIPK